MGEPVLWETVMKSQNWFLPVCLGIVLMAFLAEPSRGGNFFHGVSPANLSLPGGIAYYQFNTNLTAAEQQTYLDGLREWELAANIHFVPYTNQTNWIVFNYAPGTSIDEYNVSSVPWTVTINVLSRSQICHEMGHVLGLEHENIRTDKNTYVTVLTNNISPPSNISWFTIDPTSMTNGPYDFESVMHLANNFSSVDPANLYTQVANPGYERFQPFMGNLALSAGDRAAVAYLYGPPTVLLTNIVTMTADAGSGSLRGAIYYGIDHPGTTIRFNIPTNDPGFSNNVFTIHLTGYLPPLVANGTVIDGSTQPGFTTKPLIVIDGSQMIPEAYIPGTATGLYIFAANCQLKNLSFQNFNWNGITLDYPGATNNTITGCWCGVDYTGTNAAPNALQGILVYNGASYNVIGGTNALQRNVLSGNSQYGVYIIGTNTTGNIVRGSYIGTDASGTKALSNAFGGMIVTGGANSNVIGGGVAGAGNLLSGSPGFSLWIDSAHNTVQGNWIGLNASGTAALPNDFGMYLLNGAKSNSVISNVISGNSAEGLRFVGAGTTANLAQGNFIGTDPTGTFSIANGFAGLTFFDGAVSNTAGGTTAATRNIISGNGGYGVVIGDPGTTGNVVEGNFIGVGRNGASEVANGAGALISNGAQNNTVGGAAAGAGNVLSGNFTRGVWITDTNTDGNLVQGNIIGLAADGVTAVANAWQGVIIINGAASNVIGLSIGGSGLGNRIACNGNEGVAIYNNSSIGNTIRGNNIYSNSYIGINLVGGTENSYGVTANHAGGAVPGPNDLQNYPVITNAETSGVNTIISGTLNSTVNRTFLIDCYRNTTADPSGYGEGQIYAGSATISTGNTGNAIFSLSTSGDFAGQYFSATASDQTMGDTSEFSLDFVATNGPPPPSFVGPFSLTGAGFAANISLTTGLSYHVQSATNLAANPLIWTGLTNFVAIATNYSFIDHLATNFHARFYRVISP
jgi:hypothetical protein